MNQAARGWREELFARRTMGVRPGLAAITTVDQALGSPCAEVPMVHVVGTNGKGSTSTMVAHLLQSEGAGPVGLFTSPHLHRVGERVRVDGRAMPDARIQSRLAEVAEAESACGVVLSFFEVLTMIALLEFRAAGVRSMVLEAGLGGRLDSTRVRRSRVIAVTSIALDHQEFLGDTLAKIAGEKAAVMHPAARVVTAAQSREVLAVLEAVAQREGCPLALAEVAARPPMELHGAHQRTNAGLALQAMAAWRGEPKDPTHDLEVLDGVSMAGRFEVLRRDECTAIFDVAHNPAGFEALSTTVRGRLGALDRVLVGWAPSRPERSMLNACPRGRMMGWVPTQAGDPTPDAPWDHVFSGPLDPNILPWVAVKGGYSLVCGSHRVVGPARAAWRGVGSTEDPALTDPTR
jgi:dihydrofolate synthase / folylpolyglutamate synthase